MMPEYEPTSDDKIGIREANAAIDREWDEIAPELKRFDPSFARESQKHDMIAHYAVVTVLLPMLGIAVGAASGSAITIWTSLAAALPGAVVIAWNAGRHERARKRVFYAYIESKRSASTIPKKTPNPSPNPTPASVTPRADG